MDALSEHKEERRIAEIQGKLAINQTYSCNDAPTKECVVTAIGESHLLYKKTQIGEQVMPIRGFLATHTMIKTSDGTVLDKKEDV
jgi:hypothetical protein